VPLREAHITITRDGRDKGGTFHLREMPAIPATEWFIRAMQLLARAGVDVPPNIMQAGAQGFLVMGIGSVVTGLGKAPWYDVKPLLDELLACVVSYQPPSGAVALAGWPTIAGQIQEASTVLQLYEEVVSLSLNFSLSARLSEFRSLAARMMTETGPNTPTSTEDAQPSSDGASPA
jgi:hypothetical protein